jgi:hypothetical protein
LHQVQLPLRPRFNARVPRLSPTRPNPPREFLAAVRDCCLANEREGVVPPSIVDELSKRVGFDEEAISPAKVQERVQSLISTLNRSEAAPDRRHAVRELAEFTRKRCHSRNNPRAER